MFFIVFVSGGFVALDWTKFFIFTKNNRITSNIYSYSAKYLIVLMTSILVFIIGRDGINKKDTTMLCLIFMFIILADLSLATLVEPYIGIFFFSIVQLLLIVRNGCGFIKNYRQDESNNLKKSLFINTILSTIFFVVNIIQILRELIDKPSLLYMMIFYALLISVSLWTAIANLLLKIFPRINAILITIAMLCFVLSDLNVGLSFALQLSKQKLFIEGIIWIFYTPALTLIAFSGYDLKRAIGRNANDS